MNRVPQSYPSEEETSNNFIASEPAAALVEQETLAVLDDIDYTNIVEGILQVTNSRKLTVLSIRSSQRKPLKIYQRK